MPTKTNRIAAIAAVATGLSAFAVNPAQAELLLGLTTGNQVVRFDSASPGTILGSAGITGVQSGESILGIDYRPATGTVIALGSSSRLYTLNPTSGVATAIGSAGVFTLTGNKFGVDLNPTVDRVRVTSDAEQNLRLNPNDGTLSGTDTLLAYAAGDTNVGANPNIAEGAYTNNFAGATTTTLFGIDSSLNTLVTQNPPNNGTLNTVGLLGFDTDDRVGFDISGTGIAFATLTAPNSVTSQLFTINLATGNATNVGFVGGTTSGIAFRGLTSLAPEPASVGTLGAAVAGMAMRRRRR